MNIFFTLIALSRFMHSTRNKEYKGFCNIDLFSIARQEYIYCEIPNMYALNRGRVGGGRRSEAEGELFKGASKFKAAQSGPCPGHVRACQRKYDFVSRALKY